jgi:monovalent cation/proton antiporter MnhG/PhaG subunit
MVTSASDRAEIIEGIDAGAYYYLVKPIDREMLCSMVRAAVFDHARVKELQREVRVGAGTLGLLRLPDFFSRTHAATKCDTIGAGSLLVALAIFNGLDASTWKILALAALVILSSPTVGHALARAAHRTGLKPWRVKEG